MFLVLIHKHSTHKCVSFYYSVSCFPELFNEIFLYIVLVFAQILQKCCYKFVIINCSVSVKICRPEGEHVDFKNYNFYINYK